MRETIPVCRVCASPEDLNIIYEQGSKHLLNMVKSFGTTVIQAENEPSQWICTNCSNDLQKAYIFKLQYEATYYKSLYKKLQNLRQQKLGTTSVKANQKPKEINSSLFTEIVVKEEINLHENNSDDQRPSWSGNTNSGGASEAYNSYLFDSQFEGHESELIDKVNSEIDGYANVELDNVLVKLESGMQSYNPELNLNNEYGSEIYAGNLINVQNYSYSKSKSNAHGTKTPKDALGIQPSDNFNIMCELCGRFYTKAKSWYHHYSRHMNQDRYKCEQCGKGFTEIRILRRHKRHKHHKHLNLEQDRIPCELCKRSFATSGHLKSHLITHGKEKSYKCKECGKTFKTLYGKKVHRYVHKKPNPEQCQQCDKIFPTKAHLKSHLRMHNKALTKKRNKKRTRNRSIVCKQCGKCFLTMLEMRKHQLDQKCLQNMLSANSEFSTNELGTKIESVSETLPVLKCQQCGVVFSDANELDAHRKIHFKSKTFQCDDCGKILASNWLLNQHKRIHSNPDCYMCKHCGKKLTTKSNLSRHEAIHNIQNILKCADCDRQFTDRHALKNHSIVHMNPSILKCELCGKKFTRIINLMQHQLFHTNPDIFKCQQCGKQYDRKEYLALHQKIHLYPDGHKCDQCGKTYLRSSSLRKHEKKHLRKE